MDLAQLDAEWGECWLEPGPVSREVETSVKRVFGGLPEWTPLLARVPWVVQAILDGADKPGQRESGTRELFEKLAEELRAY